MAKDIYLRSAVKCELKVAAFLMHMGGDICTHVASQLRIGTSTENDAIKEVSKAITSQ